MSEKYILKPSEEKEIDRRVQRIKYHQHHMALLDFAHNVDQLRGFNRVQKIIIRDAVIQAMDLLKKENKKILEELS